MADKQVNDKSTQTEDVQCEFTPASNTTRITPAPVPVTVDELLRSNSILTNMIKNLNSEILMATTEIEHLVSQLKLTNDNYTYHTQHLVSTLKENHKFRTDFLNKHSG
jgi:hypothetical protein